MVEEFNLGLPGTIQQVVTLRKLLTFGDATNSFPAKRHVRNVRRNSILMTRHYPDLGSALRPIRSTTQIWVVTCHQYGISALVSHTSFGKETSGSIAKCGLFSQASKWSEWVSNWRLRIPRSALWKLGHAASNDTYTERQGLLQQSVPLVQ